MPRPAGQAHGYFMLNSNGLEIVATRDALTWRMIGKWSCRGGAEGALSAHAHTPARP